MLCAYAQTCYVLGKQTEMENKIMEKDAKIYVAGHRGMVGSAIVRQLEKRRIYKYHHKNTQRVRSLPSGCSGGVFCKRKNRIMCFLQPQSRRYHGKQ